MLSLTRSTDFIPQTALLTPFRSPIPAVSHLDRFGFKPEKEENMLKTLSSSLIDSLFFKKKVVSSA